jgi:predicted alpha-1,2-mannosidase
MRNKLLPGLVFLSIVFTFIIAEAGESKKTDLTKYVNPLIGTAKSTTIAAMRHGSGSENNAQVYPAVTVPFGMTNWTPQTQNTENKCVSPYYHKDSLITGFRGSHWLSGSCTQDYGTLAVMPISGKLICNQMKRGSHFSHAEEVAKPDYYKINLRDYDIIAEMTATKRCGIFKFTFKKEGEAHVVINPNSDHSEGFVKVIPEKGEIIGSNPIRRIYQGWGKPAGFSGHFVLRIERAVENYGVYSENEMFPNQVSLINKPNLGAFFSFKVKKGEVVYVKIGTSFVSTDQARKNLDSEIPGYKFVSTRKNLNETWNELLSKISVEGNSLDDKIKFYTAMYHSFQQPRLYNDVDGSYPRFNGNAKTDTIKNGNYYCDFSLWDTYRALHPLYNILIPEQNADMLSSLLTMAKIGGWLPIFPKWNSYTAAMIGDHGIAVIAEAYIKGVLNLTEDDYKILKKNATETPALFSDYADGKGRRALKSYLKYGYIPLEDSVKEAFHKNEQVSRTLEYSYDDFALAQIAKKIGKQDDYNYFLKRSQNYRNVFDPNVHNMNGRFADGTFAKNFTRDAQMSFITEGTPWQYNWYVPQDVNGLIELMGGKESFNKDLDKFFEAGQYWHGNEPSHQISFLYNYSGQPWKTQRIVANTMNVEYGVGPGGLSGNDDAGQMSAWYVLGAIGFYPVSPVSSEYQISGPKFKKITIKLNAGKKLIMNAPNYSSENIFINRLIINGAENKSYSISHKLLMNGGIWNYDMSKCSKE